MKLLPLIITALTLSSSAMANQVRVSCNVNDSATTLKILKNDNGPAELKLFSKRKLIVSVSDKDVFDLTSDTYRLNAFASHHNTTLKLASDYEIFGGDSQKEGEETWNGYLFVSPNLQGETGNKSVSPITCHYEI